MVVGMLSYHSIEDQIIKNIIKYSTLDKKKVVLVLRGIYMGILLRMIRIRYHIG